MLAYSSITGRFTTAFTDPTTNTVVPLTGKITLVPFAKSIHSIEGDNPVTVLPARTTVEIGANGVMPSTEVVATNSPDTTPVDWTYQVFFDLKADGRSVVYDSFHFHAPAGEVVDLTTVAPVAEYEGVAISRGIDGTDIADVTVTGTIMTVLKSDGTSHIIDLPVLNPDNVVIVDGEDGVDGRGIASIVVNDDSSITINYTDGIDPLTVPIPTVQGLPGLSAYELALQEGFVGSLSDWLASLEGQDGLSAYEIAVANGFVGTETAWLESLKGADGTSGTGSSYDDTALTGRVSTLETSVNTDIPATYATKAELPAEYDDTALVGRVSAVENALPNKLDSSTAASTYATKTELGNKLDSTTAASTYATQTALNEKLDSTTASSTYLSKTDASNTYATKTEMPKIVVSSTAPTNPAVGTIWFKPVV